MDRSQAAQRIIASTRARPQSLIEGMCANVGTLLLVPDDDAASLDYPDLTWISRQSPRLPHLETHPHHAVYEHPCQPGARPWNTELTDLMLLSGSYQGVPENQLGQMAKHARNGQSLLSLAVLSEQPDARPGTRTAHLRHEVRAQLSRLPYVVGTGHWPAQMSQLAPELTDTTPVGDVLDSLGWWSAVWDQHAGMDWPGPLEPRTRGTGFTTPTLDAQGPGGNGAVRERLASWLGALAPDDPGPVSLLAEELALLTCAFASQTLKEGTHAHVRLEMGATLATVCLRRVHAVDTGSVEPTTTRPEQPGPQTGRGITAISVISATPGQRPRHWEANLRGTGGTGSSEADAAGDRT